MRVVLASVLLVSLPAFAVAQPAQPPRDSSARPTSSTGTAAIKGRVFAGDTGKPLRRVRVTASAPEVPGQGREASTDAEGRYELTELPAGRYTLRAERGGYLAVQYGQRRPLEQGKPVQLLDQQAMENMDFSMPRMGLITGRVTDENNEPIEGVTVYALRSMYFNGRRQFVPTGSSPQVRTDDDGSYRLRGLAPGTYLVQAKTSETWTVIHDKVKDVMGYAPSYYPGTTSVAQARKVTVRLGREAGNIDFSIIPGRAATVSGHAFDAHGKPLQGVNISEEIRGDTFASFGGRLSSRIESDGSFIIRNVSPGEYMINAATPNNAAEPSVARMPLTVDGQDLTDIELIGASGGTVSGRVVADDGSSPTIQRLRITVREFAQGQPSPIINGAYRNSGFAEVGSDGTFSVEGVYGRSRLRVLGLPDEWAVKAVLHEGRDIAEQQIELRGGEAWTDVQVVLTKTITALAGQLTDVKGLPMTDGTVVVFATDADKWTEDSRYVRAARPDAQGQWQVKGAPPGEYFVVALDAVENGQWYESEFLEAIRQHGLRVVLTEGKPQTAALKLVTLDQQQ